MREVPMRRQSHSVYDRQKYFLKLSIMFVAVVNGILPFILERL